MRSLAVIVSASSDQSENEATISFTVLALTIRIVMNTFKEVYLKINLFIEKNIHVVQSN